MVFKKNEKFIRAYELTVFFCMVILLVSLVIMAERQTVSWEMILICVMDPILMLCILEYAFKGGFFHDAVCCDEHGIKVIMRKTTYDCP